MPDYVTLRILEKTRRKLKIAAARRGVPLLALVDELADQEVERQNTERPTPPADQGRA